MRVGWEEWGSPGAGRRMTPGLALQQGGVTSGVHSQLPDLFVHFKCNSKTSPRDAISISVVQVRALTTQG